jgi:hypothetical protein
MDKAKLVTLFGLGTRGGAGDVVGPASSTDNAFVRFDGATGKLIQNSSVICDDSANVSGIADLNVVAFYIGDKTTNGSWRIIVDGTKNLSIQQLVSTVWTKVGSFETQIGARMMAESIEIPEEIAAVVKPTFMGKVLNMFGFGKGQK